MIWGLLKLILFRIDAEWVHDLTHAILRALGRRKTGRLLLQVVARAPQPPSEPPRVFGQTFRSRIGLAAGFDKNAELLPAVSSLGFGFAEIGTVTPRPQSGNEKPRLFRDPETRNLFNRMGFNGAGAEEVSLNLRHARFEGELPLNFKIGVNLGKNKETSAEDAHIDYTRAARAFEGLADYLVVNVSSPNTPGLRELQQLEPIARIVSSVNEVISGWKTVPPLLLKLAPEVEGPIFEKILTEGPRLGISGWVLTNTWGGEWKKNSYSAPLLGGWSGSILTQKSGARLKEARVLTKLPIISVGGILSVEDAKERLKWGADLIQIYTGWVYGGPGFPARIARAIHPEK